MSNTTASSPDTNFLFLRRSLAGFLDGALFFQTFLIISELLVVESALLMLFCIILFYLPFLLIFQTTAGGVICKLVTISNDGKKLTSSRAVLKFLTVNVTNFLLVIGVAISYELVGPDSNNIMVNLEGQQVYRMGLVLFFWSIFSIINLVTYPFTKNKLMIHDILSRTRVIGDQRGIFGYLPKNIIWTTLILVFLTSLFLDAKRDEKHEKKCSEIFQSKDYRAFVKRCSHLESENMMFPIGYSQYRIGNYGEAINSLTKAYTLGNQRAVDYIILSQIEKDDFDKALKLSETVNRPLALYMSSSIYFKKYRKAKSNEDILKSYAYIRAFIEKFGYHESKRTYYDVSIPERTISAMEEDITEAAKNNLSPDELTRSNKLMQEIVNSQ